MQCVAMFHLGSVFPVSCGNVNHVDSVTYMDIVTNMDILCINSIFIKTLYTLSCHI